MFDYPEEGSPMINTKKNMNNLAISGTGMKRKIKPRIESLSSIWMPLTQQNINAPSFKFPQQNKMKSKILNL